MFNNTHVKHETYGNRNQILFAIEHQVSMGCVVDASAGVVENGRKIVIEGNRRLAAVKAILEPSAILNGGMNRYKERITQKLLDDLTNNLPIIILNSREDTWRYIGFKHVNGAVKWDSYAKEPPRQNFFQSA